MLSLQAWLHPEIVHKTAAGGVILDINSDVEVKQAFDMIMQRAKEYNAKANIIGVTVQPMIKRKGYEVIIGGKTDPLFGPGTPGRDSHYADVPGGGGQESHQHPDRGGFARPRRSEKSENLAGLNFQTQAD